MPVAAVAGMSRPRLVGGGGDGPRRRRGETGSVPSSLRRRRLLVRGSTVTTTTVQRFPTRYRARLHRKPQTKPPPPTEPATATTDRDVGSLAAATPIDNPSPHRRHLPDHRCRRRIVKVRNLRVLGDRLSRRRGSPDVVAVRTRSPAKCAAWFA